MTLLLDPNVLYAVSPGDAGVKALADRHYSRKRPGKGNWWPPAKTLALTNSARTILFAWQHPKTEYRRDGQEGYNCIIFRNEDRRRASAIIVEAEQIIVEAWGPGRAYTYVDPTAVKVVKVRGVPMPGFCFIKAGWEHEGNSASGKMLFVKMLE